MHTVMLLDHEVRGLNISLDPWPCYTLPAGLINTKPVGRSHSTPA